MNEKLGTIPPEIWFAQIFTSKSAQRGGVVRRAVRDVERIMGRSTFERWISQRGYRAIENGDQYIILCNRLPIRIID